MLTNNNKRGFVKLIALTLAALMVFAVCLTGCTDEDARKAAEDAQSTANAAQTAADAAMSEEEVAAAIAKALEGYLKAEGAVTDADVKKAIEDSLKNYQAKGDYATKGDVDKKQDKIDLSAYAKSADVKKVADDLAKHTKGAVTSAAVAEQIKKALAEYEIEKKIAAAIDNIDTLSADAIQAKIEAAIAETLENYYTKAETDAKIAEALEAYFGEFTPEEVTALLAGMDKAMTTDEWNKATLKVVATLKAAEALFKKLEANSYRQANKAKINDLMANIKVSDDVTIKTEIVVFPTLADGSLNDFYFDNVHSAGTDTFSVTNKILSQLTVHILRSPDEAYIDAIAANIIAATAVPNFADEIAAIKDRIYALGNGATLANIDILKDGAYDDGEKYTADTQTYHGTTFAKNAVKAVQVVTVADQGAFNQIKVDLEEMIVAYSFEAFNFDSKHFFDYDDIWSKWTKANNTTIYMPAGYYKGEKWGKIDLTALRTADTGVAGKDRPDGYTFVGYYAGINGEPIASYDSTNYPYTAPWGANTVTTGYSVTGYFDKLHLDPLIKVDLPQGTTAAYTTSGKLAQVLNQATKNSSVVSLDITYAAVIQMLADAKAAVDQANFKFSSIDHGKPSFLLKIAHNHSHNSSNNACQCTLKSDAEYINLLRDYMCEQTESDKMIQVPTAAPACGSTCKSDWTVAPWLSPVQTVSGDIAPWTSGDAQANTVEVYMNYALNINGLGQDATSFDAIAKYDLYRQLMAKAWELLYKKYQNYALEILQTMVNDYTIAANAAYLSQDPATYVTLNAQVAASMNLHNDQNAIVPVWTAGFLPAFFNYTDGTTAYTWQVGDVVKKDIGPEHQFKGLSQYYKNNGKAQVVEVKIDDQNNATWDVVPVKSDVLKAIANHVNTFGANNNVYVELSTVSVDPRTAIITEAANYKDSGLTEFEWKKANIGRVQDAFDEELALAKKNLDEIINRYTFEDVKKAMLNDVYAYVSENAYATYKADNTAHIPTYIAYPQDVYAAGKGIATYFAQNTTADKIGHGADNGDAVADSAYDDALLETLEDILKKYVTGYNDCANVTVNNTQAAKKDPVRLGFSVTPVTVNSGAKIVDYTITYLEDNGSVKADLEAIVIQQNAEFKNLYDLKYTATEKIAEAEAVINTAVAELANEAVKYRFNDYLKDARDALLYAHMSYEAVASTYSLAYELKTEYNTYLNNITRIEYLWNLGLSEEAGVHFDIFVGSLLGTAIAYDSPYYALVAKDATYTSQLKNIASASKVTNAASVKYNVAMTYASNWNQDDPNYKGTKIVFPVSLYNGSAYLNTYNATGAAMSTFDKIINRNASSQDGKVKLY